MKKIVFLMLALSLIVFSCRKLVLREVDLDATDQHCSNYAMDVDEIGLDCGGADCDACIQTTLPCTLNSNEMKVSTNGFTLSTKTFTNQQIDTSSTGTSWTFKAYTNSTDFLSIYFTAKPSVTQIYAGQVDASFLESTEAYVVYYQPSTFNLYGSGSVYVNYNAGVYTIASCDYPFHQWGSGTPSLTQTFSVTF